MTPGPSPVGVTNLQCATPPRSAVCVDVSRLPPALAKTCRFPGMNQSGDLSVRRVLQKCAKASAPESSRGSVRRRFLGLTRGPTAVQEHSCVGGGHFEEIVRENDLNRDAVVI